MMFLFLFALLLQATLWFVVNELLEVVQTAHFVHTAFTGCMKEFSKTENYKENAYKMTNSLTVFHVLEIIENLKFSCNFPVLAFHKLRKF